MELVERVTIVFECESTMFVRDFRVIGVIGVRRMQLIVITNGNNCGAQIRIVCLRSAKKRAQRMGEREIRW